MNPGRKKDELRNADLVATGDIVLLGSGVIWTVLDHCETKDGKLQLSLARMHNQRILKDWWTGDKNEQIIVRNDV
jgi:hypothetical protein